MANNQNLKPFGSTNKPPANRGRKKGSPNRSAVIRKWLECTIKSQNLDGTEQKMTVLDTLVLAQIKRASLGDTSAFNTLMDGAFGKIPTTLQTEIKNIPQPPLIINIDEITETI